MLERFLKKQDVRCAESIILITAKCQRTVDVLASERLLEVKKRL